MKFRVWKPDRRRIPSLL